MRLRKPSLPYAIALAGLALALVPVVALLAPRGSPGWTHLWCSPATLRSAGRGVGAALAVHWPHFLPLALALATLVYLHRSDRRQRG